ncbi:uncharacterized protein SCHCODRAFT_02624643 [Schizophyllum commune H4-8]|uniref:uncharacterized protein n=1 Tax=Schizophyllum commune (strain H4-8 / FGSC 9210) TaxID=578458 RepID=UPI00215F1C53|nr:uncharacterized protein SCHCODRAFT_02624643 [Schizophyllum commune H4-8]KAI5894427.1 hypothetical protein SCHCODRAFT_02624643 [Schizophyllum commune H4-8]
MAGVSGLMLRASYWTLKGSKWTLWVSIPRACREVHRGRSVRGLMRVPASSMAVCATESSTVDAKSESASTNEDPTVRGLSPRAEIRWRFDSRAKVSGRCWRGRGRHSETSRARQMVDAGEVNSGSPTAESSGATRDGAIDCCSDAWPASTEITSVRERRR